MTTHTESERHLYAHESSDQIAGLCGIDKIKKQKQTLRNVEHEQSAELRTQYFLTLEIWFWFC